MNKILLIALTLLLTSCYNQKPEEEPTATYPYNHPESAIITPDGTIIFYHEIKEIWDEAMEMLY